MLNAQLNTNRAHQTAEQLKEYQNEYYQNNRAKILLKQNERIFCKICGKTYTRVHKAWHNRSKHHQKCLKFNQSKISTNEKFNKCVKFNNTI